MGPTNVSLVKLYRADQALRDAQERLDAATKNARLQDRRVNDAAAKLKALQQSVRELSSKSGNLDLDLRSRDAHIEKLRTQQQVAKNNKEYQAFLVEINTQKVDKSKVEEQTMAVMTELETAQKAATEAATVLESEQAKLAQLKSQMGDTVKALQAEIESLKGPRESAAAALPPKARDVFNRLADHHDGEAMSALMKPDRRKEEYVCSACMMDLVTDVYNKLHSRDEMVFCPSCRRVLYIPDDLPPELAVNKKRSGSVSSASAGESAEPGEKPAPKPRASRAKGKLGELLTAAQGESVKNAVDAQQNPLEFRVSIDGKAMGTYKAKSGENLERVIKFRMDEAKLTHVVTVEPVILPAASAPQGLPEAGQAQSEPGAEGSEAPAAPSAPDLAASPEPAHAEPSV
jgi:predicted  nucleic acid-binding Zn-ribbon protein